MAIPSILIKLDALEKKMDELNFSGTVPSLQSSGVDQTSLIFDITNLSDRVSNLENETAKINTILDKISKMEAQMNVSTDIVDRLNKLEDIQVPAFVTDKLSSLESNMTSFSSVIDRVIELEARPVSLVPNDFLDKLSKIESESVPALDTRIKTIEDKLAEKN